MGIYIREYSPPIILKEGESPNFALLRAEVEHISHSQHPLELDIPQDVTPTGEKEYSYEVFSVKGKAMVVMKPNQENNVGCAADTRGNTFVGVRGKRRFSLQPERGRVRFPILQKTPDGNISIQRVIFASSLE